MQFVRLLFLIEQNLAQKTYMDLQLMLCRRNLFRCDEKFCPQHKRITEVWL